MSKQTKNANKKTKKNPVPKKKQNTSILNSRSVVAPIARGSQVTSSRPSFGNQKAYSVPHSELIGTVVPKAAGFQTAMRLRINPASKATFDWLPSIAVNFEFYRFRRIRLVYRTRSSTTDVGSVIISPDYDSEDHGVPLSERNLFNNLGTTDTSVWIDHHIDLKPSLMNRLFSAHVCMSDGRFSTSKQDIKTIDCAQVHICTDVGESMVGAQIGKLFIEYEVDFFGPQSPTESLVDDGVRFSSNTSGADAEAPIAKGNATLTLSKLSNQFFKTPNQMKPYNNWDDNQSTVGQFQRDYEGIINVFTRSISGQVHPARLALLPLGGKAPTDEQMNNAFGALGNIPLPTVPDIQTDFRSISSNQMVTTRRVKALAGDLLKIGVNNLIGDTFPGNLILDFGGNGVFHDIL